MYEMSERMLYICRSWHPALFSNTVFLFEDNVTMDFSYYQCTEHSSTSHDSCGAQDSNKRYAL